MVARLSKIYKSPLASVDTGYRIEFIQDGVCLLEGDQPVRAAVGFISFGPVHSAVSEAMSMFKKIHFPAAAFFLDSKEPFPSKALEAFAEKVFKIVVIETEADLSLSKMVTAMTWINPLVLVPPSGRSLTALDIFGKEDWN